MKTGPSQKENQENQQENINQISKANSFRLRDFVTDELHYLVMTTLPRANYVDRLWNIAETVGNEIADCLNMLYCQVTQRNGSGEGKPHYFYHVGATSIYETQQKKIIKGKNHSLKAGDVFKKVLKTLKKIDNELKAKKELEKDNLQLLKYFKSELMVQHNVLIFSLQKASDKTREHLSRHSSLDVSKLEAIELSSKHQKRAIKAHASAVDVTPKKPSSAALRTRVALQATEPTNEQFAKVQSVAKKLF